MNFLIRGLSLLLLFFCTSLTIAESTTPGKVIAGWVEKISFHDNNFITKAKLDSGAKTSSIFAKDIKKYMLNDAPWVDFTLVLRGENDTHHQIPMSAPLSRRVKIKNHDGDHDRRIVVEISFCFDGRLHEAEFTLADRSEYIYPVLLGRSFLKDVAVIDPDATFLTKATCKPSETINFKQLEKTDE
mgnify:FL=1